MESKVMWKWSKVIIKDKEKEMCSSNNAGGNNTHVSAYLPAK